MASVSRSITVSVIDDIVRHSGSVFVYLVRIPCLEGSSILIGRSIVIESILNVFTCVDKANAVSS